MTPSPSTFSVSGPSFIHVERVWLSFCEDQVFTTRVRTFIFWHRPVCPCVFCWWSNNMVCLQCLHENLISTQIFWLMWNRWWGFFVSVITIFTKKNTISYYKILTAFVNKKVKAACMQEIEREHRRAINHSISAAEGLHGLMWYLEKSMPFPFLLLNSKTLWTQSQFECVHREKKFCCWLKLYLVQVKESVGLDFSQFLKSFFVLFVFSKITAFTPDVKMPVQPTRPLKQLNSSMWTAKAVRYCVSKLFFFFS